MEDRFIENLGILSEKELSMIQSKKVIIVGLGGLGGNVTNQLVRLGVKHVSLVDFDVFDESNLNRQLFSSEEVIGKYKVDVIKDNLLKINSSISIKTYKKKIENVPDDIFEHHDFVIDAVDQPVTKVYLNLTSSRHHIPLLHGACAGWYGQVGWIEPECNLLIDLYKNKQPGLEKELRNPPFTPSFTASVMVSEFVKYILDKSTATVNELLLIDVKNNVMSKTGGTAKW